MPNSVQERRVLSLKGYNFGIPSATLGMAFNKCKELIIREGITTLAWDGDLQTYVHKSSTTGIPVKSFTLLLLMIYSWSIQIGYSIEYIFGKKTKSIDKLFNGAKCALDDHGTYLGPYHFLDVSNTLVLEDNKTAVLNPGYNIGVAIDNDVSWKELGVTLMKWMKNAGVHEVHLLVIGAGEVVTKELAALEKLGDAVPILHTEIMQFTRDAVP